MATNSTTSFLGTFHGKTDSVYTLPAAGSSVVISPEPGAYTQFLFKIDQISNVSTRPDGALEMKMVNNSTMVVENFQDLVNSAESCGRDSILQFLADQPVAGGGEPITKIVNIAPDALARALDPALANSNTVVVHEPAPGVTHEIMMVPGKIYQFDFDMQHTAKTMDGTNLLLSFKDGGLVILRDYVPVMNGELPPALTLADGTVIDASKMLATVCAPSETPFDTLKAMAAPNVEPAAGDKKVAHAVHHEPTPEKLADIEPAAGTPSAAISGGRGGGFSAGIDPANLNGLNPLGPLGPTELVYGIPRPTDVPVLVGTPPGVVVPPNPVDGTPVIGDQTQSVDETNLVSGPLTVSGQLANNYGSDGAGTTGHIAAQGTFASGGSQTNGTLSSNGVPVVVTLSGNTYTGTAGGQTVFTVLVNADGSYTYTQYANLDHADGTNPNDVITLNFGVVITDADGDADTGVITINVADDAPIAHDDAGPSGNVMANDTMSVDTPTLVTSVVFGGQTYTVPNGGQITANGANGTLVIGSNGSYTYTPSNSHGDTFTYTITDRDGDTSSAQIVIAANNNGVPTIGDGLCPVDETNLSAGPTGVIGTYTYNYGVDGPGTITGIGFGSSGSMTNGQLTSGGVPVVVTQNGNLFTGTANGQTVFTMTLTTTGSYTFMLYHPLDHADGSNPNDVINLDFNVQITDSDGDTDTGTMRITVADDGVIAIDDVGAPSGNVMTNDWYSNDQPMSISQITLNGVVHTIPSGGSVTIAGSSGILVMNSDGHYTYTPTGGAGDNFTYTLRDYDGDTSQAHLTFGQSQGNGVPVIGDATGQVDETALWNFSSGKPTVTGQLGHDFGTDGAGTIVPTGISGFTANGSILNNQLAMGGLPVVVTQTGNTYEGHVVDPSDGSNIQIFVMTINTDGSYSFVLHNTMDHADGNNPNDVITLNFGVTITDANGDTDTGVIKIDVLDDAPVAQDDTATLDQNHTAQGSLYGNDHYSYDDQYLKTIVANGVTHDIPKDQQVTIPTTYGTLTIQNGQWSYVAHPGVSGTDVITYTVIDLDGDQSTAHLTIPVDNGVPNGVPTIGDGTQSVDETNLGPVTVNGTLAYDYGTDGPGVIAATASSFNSSGSLKNGMLTSNGVAVDVTLSGNTYTGMAAGVLVFVLAVHANGTYDFTLHNNIDHADANNPNDIINLNFGVTITDANGDHDTGTITVQVADDAPIARDDSVSAVFNNNGIGNVMDNDTSHEHALVTQVSYHGQTYTVTSGVDTVINADHGQLTIGQNGHYTYHPYDVTSETLWLNVSAADVSGSNDTSVTHNGMTVTAINPQNGNTLGDLSWVYGDLNIDGTWYGEQGLGVTGQGSNFVNGQNEGLRLSFDQPTDHVSITIGGFNSMGDFVDGVSEPYLQARVYLNGSSQPTIVTLEQGQYSGYGFATYDLDASQFGNLAITRIEVYATNAQTDWTLCNVSYANGGTGGTDTFGYTIQDQDGDVSSAFLNASNATQAHGLSADTHTMMIKVDNSVIAHTDDVTKAIEDFVVSTTHNDVMAPTPANDHHYIEAPILTADTTQDLYHASAA